MGITFTNGFTISSPTPAAPASPYDLLVKLDSSDAGSYPGTGTTWYDLQGSNNGTLNSGSGEINYAGEYEGVFDLSGGTGTKITIANGPDVQLSASTTKAYSIWFKADAVGFMSFSRTLMCKLRGLGGSSTTDGFWMGINNSNQLVAKVASDNGTRTSYISGIGATISTNTWYMGTLLVKVSSDSDTFKLFINDIEVGTTNGGGSFLSSDSNNLLLGNYDTGVQGAQPFDGMLGEFYVHSGTFGIDEITSLFNDTKARFGY